ncbi:MAG: hypothetical protein SV760_01330 [Halobacteria archaeon]|nr:hypothetical protein [Halobacteria archaeon]
MTEKETPNSVSTEEDDKEVEADGGDGATLSESRGIRYSFDIDVDK